MWSGTFCDTCSRFAGGGGKWSVTSEATVEADATDEAEAVFTVEEASYLVIADFLEDWFTGAH